ncbi:MAG: ABC transporter ATP-binding protein [Ectothiorhodospiraceae bacterium]|nr:ABC transporter ATP-binding protein [Planctomycetota bacterium]MCP5154251.1 ABC transporter ATP-binding protein [Ectothiorhodospiraceae bacterium]
MKVVDTSWPVSRVGEAMEALARAAGLQPAPGLAPALPDGLEHHPSDDLCRWIEWAAQSLGLEAEATETTGAELDAMLGRVGPALLAFHGEGGLRLLLAVRARRGRVVLLAPDLRRRAFPVARVREVLRARLESPVMAELAHVLERVAIPARQRARVLAAMVDERLSGQRIGGCWLLRTPPTAGFWSQLVAARLPRRLGAVMAVAAVVMGLEVLGWSLIGGAALGGHLDLTLLAAWVIALLSAVPLGLLGGWVSGTLALDLGALVKQRLLMGALRTDLDDARVFGAGQLLGRAMEAGALEALASGGGLGVVVSAVELAFATWVLALGAGGALHVALLAVWTLLTIWAATRYGVRLRDWTRSRIDLTHDLVERMVGHRTRLAQEWPGRREQADDRALDDYHARSARMDRAVIPTVTVIPGGWLLVGLLGLAPGFVAEASSSTGLAIGLGGVLLANRALAGVSGALGALMRAGIAWKEVGDLFVHGADAPRCGPFLPSSRPRPPGAVLVRASRLTFTHRAAVSAAVADAELVIRRGDRILVEGSSGGGKSTLAALLTGLRRADSGLLLLDGLDRGTLGDAWHGLASGAPQFHENHVLSASLAFNLLMGRGWPASDEDIEEARALCEELGLGPLLARMPAGIFQIVGETGWQLSHGERSRLFLARALLQDAELTVLDESFAALDPETVATCLACAARRARTLVVIAHP